MKFDCPHCAQRLEIADEWSGHALTCPSCQQALTAPVPEMAIALREEPTGGLPTRPPRRVLRPAPSKYTPSLPPRRGGGGFGKFLLALLIFAGAGFGYAMVHFNESPQQVWKRLIEVVQKLVNPAPVSRPAPESSPTPTPTPTPTPVAKPEPTARPMATPTSTPTPVNPIAWLCNHRERAPKQLLLRAPVTFAITENSRESGQLEVPAGATAELVDFTPRTVDLRIPQCDCRPCSG